MPGDRQSTAKGLAEVATKDATAIADFARTRLSRPIHLEAANARNETDLLVELAPEVKGCHHSGMPSEGAIIAVISKIVIAKEFARLMVIAAALSISKHPGMTNPRAK